MTLISHCKLFNDLVDIFDKLPFSHTVTVGVVSSIIWGFPVKFCGKHSQMVEIVGLGDPVASSSLKRVPDLRIEFLCDLLGNKNPKEAGEVKELPEQLCRSSSVPSIQTVLGSRDKNALHV